MLNIKDCPESEYSLQFIQGMIDRMRMSYFKYGAVRDAYPHKVNALESMQKRLDKYMDTGNLEWLIDMANFCMIEFMASSHPSAHFKPTDSHESPGRAAYDTNFDMTSADNKELTDKEWKELRANV
jgi:hypothetical protein